MNERKLSATPEAAPSCFLRIRPANPRFGSRLPSAKRSFGKASRGSTSSRFGQHLFISKMLACDLHDQVATKSSGKQSGES
ncbi:MAG TPA: hypothetical protein DCZ49_04310 [Hyphomonadaceae bacterium]|nr:hypothetical protein [Hyphomonadaceae bacterium]